MSVQEVKKDVFLINKLYVGKYLVNNLGHEIINLIRADGETDKNGDGQNYIYAQPWGTINKKFNDRVDTILLVRKGAVPNTLEVLAKAWDLEQIIKLKNASYQKEVENLSAVQKDSIAEKKIKYDDLSIDTIFCAYENKELANDKTIYTTFKAGKLRRPKPDKKLLISFSQKKIDVPKDTVVVYLNNINKKANKNAKISDVINQTKSSLKEYIENGTIIRKPNKTYPKREKENQSYAFKQLKNMLENDDLWEKTNTTKTASEISGTKFRENNFIDLVDKQYAEVTYSNIFQHIFESNIDLFRMFAKNILKVELSPSVEILREKPLTTKNSESQNLEKGCIDLFIESENKTIIVIENKIKAAINSVKYENGKVVSSQLSKYHDYIKKEYSGLNHKFFIFAPNYSDFDEKEINKPIKGKDKFKIVKYSQIYKFFEEKFEEYGESIPYYKEFLYALSKHINEVDNTQEIEMHNRFIKAIDKAKSTSKYSNT